MDDQPQQSSSSSSSTVVKATDERVMKDVPPPQWTYIDSKELFDSDGLPNIPNIKKHLLKEGRLAPKDAITLIQKAAVLFRNEPNLLQLQDPITGKLFTSSSTM